MCEDPYVTTLTHLRGFTAQEQYVVPIQFTKCVSLATKKRAQTGNTDCSFKILAPLTT